MKMHRQNYCRDDENMRAKGTYYSFISDINQMLIYEKLQKSWNKHQYQETEIGRSTATMGP